MDSNPFEQATFNYFTIYFLMYASFTLRSWRPQFPFLFFPYKYCFKSHFGGCFNLNNKINRANQARVG